MKGMRNDGTCCFDKPQDCSPVTVTLRDAEAVWEIFCRASRRELFGGAIRSARELPAGWECLGGDSGLGCLDFAIRARLKTAVRRARGLNMDRMRTMLFCPASQPKMFLNAPVFQPDAILFDLEDAVAYAEKDSARTCSARPWCRWTSAPAGCL